MLARRIALAVGLLAALALSQLPEFVQQYRQRLGGALDELRREVAAFDAEAAAERLGRDAALARLDGNSDPLARARADDLRGDVGRMDRLSAQEAAFAEAGPIGRYWVFAARLDPGVAARAYAAFAPAVPATPAGFAAAGVGFAFGYAGTRAALAPLRRRRRRIAAA